MNKHSPRHFLQSKEWGMFQKTLGNTIIERSGKGWRYLAILERGDGKVGKYFTRLYCPYGPYYEDESSIRQALIDLEEQARSLKVDYVRVEPTGINRTVLFDGNGEYTKKKHSFQPELTLLVNLTGEFPEVLQAMSKTNRYLWNKVERNKLTFKISYNMSDLEHFLLMMRETSERTKAMFRQSQYFELLLETLGESKHAGVAYASHEDEVLVGVLFVDDFVAKTRYYLYAGSFDKARQYSANAPLVVYLLKQAKESGIETFDFFGVSPQEATEHRWAGLSKFKRSFGGEELAFTGTWEKPINNTRYKLMNFARKFA
jgi:lipid II:glycine glycyltransferase (peptidoglycan interpeptide bridge formation enzyme)